MAGSRHVKINRTKFKCWESLFEPIFLSFPPTSFKSLTAILSLTICYDLTIWADIEDSKWMGEGKGEADIREKSVFNIATPAFEPIFLPFLARTLQFLFLSFIH